MKTVSLDRLFDGSNKTEQEETYMFKVVRLEKCKVVTNIERILHLKYSAFWHLKFVLKYSVFVKQEDNVYLHTNM